MSAINYNLKNIKGVVFDIDGVLSPVTIPIADNGNPTRMANIRDGYALQLAVKRGLRIAIITGAHCPAVVERFKALGITDIFTHASNKLPILNRWMVQNELTPEEVAYAGDDIPDLPPMKAVGLPVAPVDAAVEAKEAAVYISPIAGGYGVARDLIEQILKAQGAWLCDEEAFGW